MKKSISFRKESNYPISHREWSEILDSPLLDIRACIFCIFNISLLELQQIMGVERVVVDKLARLTVIWICEKGGSNAI